MRIPVAVSVLFFSRPFPLVHFMPFFHVPWLCGIDVFFWFLAACDLYLLASVRVCVSLSVLVRSKPLSRLRARAGRLTELSAPSPSFFFDSSHLDVQQEGDGTCLMASLHLVVLM